MHFKYSQHAKTLTPRILDQVQSLAQRPRVQWFDLAAKFAPQLAEYVGQDAMPEPNEALQFLIKRSSTYFTQKITGLLQGANARNTVADNQAVGEALAPQPHATLYRHLPLWRGPTSQRTGRPPRETLPNASLRELVTYLPTDTPTFATRPLYESAGQSAAPI